MKKYFFTGLVIFLPVTLTIILMIFLFNLFSDPFIPLVSTLLNKIQPLFPFELKATLHLLLTRILALIFLVLFVFLLGAVTRWFLIRHLLHAANTLMARIPLLKTIFKVSRDVLSALFEQDGKKAFQRPVLVPFPNIPDYGIAFLIGEAPRECQLQAKTPLSAVFCPTVPHPISGFLLLVKTEHVHEVAMTNEEALKLLISCGVIYSSKKPQ